MKKHKPLAATSLALAAALCLALAGCGGSSGSSSSSVDGASSGGNRATQSTSASSGAESSSAASSSSGTAASDSSSLAAADYTAGNGTLDCEYVTIEVTGQDVWNHSDGTEGRRLLLHITNKTDRNIALDPTFEWDINGNAGYGLIMENPRQAALSTPTRSGPMRMPQPLARAGFKARPA